LVFLIQATNITNFILYTVYHPFNYEGHQSDEAVQNICKFVQNHKNRSKLAKNRGYLNKKDKKKKNNIKKWGVVMKKV
jgi:hypothetical protein